MGVMQMGDGFVFNVDEPRERPTRDGEALSGWVAALRPVTAVRFCGAAETELELLGRPDVEAAFPGYPHVTGFSGRIDSADFRDRAPHFVFEGDGVARRAEIALPPAPPPPAAWRRLLARSEAALARWRLRGEPSIAVKWSEGLRLLLANTRARRGAAFDRATGELVLQHFAQTFPDACVVQIGANDGFSGDPLVRWFGLTRWSGLLVEPIPHLAEALALRYAGRPGVRVEKAAVAERDGEVTLYRVADEPGAPAWYQQLATLDRSVLLKHGPSIPNLESRIIQESVPAFCVKSLLERHEIDRIDLLVIDAEGFDWQILRQFDLSRFRPRLMMFEHQHLSAGDKASASAMIRRHGYRQVETPEGDALAWRST